MKCLSLPGITNVWYILRDDLPSDVVYRSVAGIPIRQIEVYEGLLAKFSQNAELGARLEATGTALLAECAVKDRIWGIGLSMHDPDRFNPSQWRGRNLLGYALMLTRRKLSRID